MVFNCNMDLSSTIPATPGTSGHDISNQTPIDTTTTAFRVGETTKLLFQVETKTAEVTSISRMYKIMVDLGIGTPDIERSATILASQSSNNRGKVIKGKHGPSSQLHLTTLGPEAGATGGGGLGSHATRDLKG